MNFIGNFPISFVVVDRKMTTSSIIHQSKITTSNIFDVVVTYRKTFETYGTIYIFVG